LVTFCETQDGERVEKHGSMADNLHDAGVTH